MNLEIPSLPDRKSMKISKSVWNSLTIFRTLFVFLRNTARHYPVNRVVDSVLVSTGYEEHIQKTDPDKVDDKLDNIRSMAAWEDNLSGLDGLEQFVQVGFGQLHLWRNKISRYHTNSNICFE